MPRFTISDATPKDIKPLIDSESYIKDCPMNKDKELIFYTVPTNTLEPVFNSGIVEAAFRAYSNHHELVLRPDDIWFSIWNSLATYIDIKAESMKNYFVQHDDKVHITINVGSSALNPIGKGTYANEDWEYIMDTFRGTILKHINPDIRELLTAEFTTSTNMDKLVTSMALMGAMKNYFSYEVYFDCSLPAINLQGTKEDWLMIKNKVALIGDKIGGTNPDLLNWFNVMSDVLDKIILTFDATQENVDKDFWNSICHYIPGGSGPSYISGWILAFYPIDSVTNKFQLKDLDEICRSGKYGKMQTGHIPSGLVQIPIHINDNGYEFDTIAYAGSLFTEYNPETNVIKPVYNIFITKQDEISSPQ